MAMDAIGTSDTLQVVVKIGAMLAAQLVMGHPTNLAVYAKGNIQMILFYTKYQQFWKWGGAIRVSYRISTMYFLTSYDVTNNTKCS